MPRLGAPEWVPPDDWRERSTDEAPDVALHRSATVGVTPARAGNEALPACSPLPHSFEMPPFSKEGRTNPLVHRVRDFGLNTSLDRPLLDIGDLPTNPHHVNATSPRMSAAIWTRSTPDWRACVHETATRRGGGAHRRGLPGAGCRDDRGRHCHCFPATWYGRGKAGVRRFHLGHPDHRRPRQGGRQG